MQKLFPEKNIHLIFEVSVLAKGALASMQIILGGILFFLPANFFPDLAAHLTNRELTQDADDFIATNLLCLAQSLTIGGRYFAAIYLASHGLIKLFLIIALLKNKLWAYPASFAIFSFFGIYQIYRWLYTHSAWLIFFTILDLIVLSLIVHEYLYLKKHRQKAEPPAAASCVQ